MVAGSTAAALLPNLGEAQTPKASNVVQATTAKSLVEQFHELRKNPKHNIFASCKVSTAFRMHAEVLEADGSRAAMSSAIRNGASTIYTKEFIQEQFQTLAKMGVHLSAEEKSYAISHMISASRAAAPTVREVAASGNFLKMQQAVHSTMIDHQHGIKRTTMSPQVSAIMVKHSGVSDAVFYLDQKPELKRVDEEYWVYADGWTTYDGGGGSNDPHAPGQDLSADPGGGGGGGSSPPNTGPDDPNGTTIDVNGKNTEVITPSGAKIQACTVYYATSSMLAGVGGGAIALLDAIGFEVGVAVGAGVILSAPVLIAIAAILVAIWGYLAVVC